MSEIFFDPLCFFPSCFVYVNIIHMKQGRTGKRQKYHHGNLRQALVDVARRLIVDRGPQGFSLVEAASLAGVSPAAPYRHFANREALLAEVALSGYKRFADELEQAWQGGQPDPLSAFMRMGEVYLGFAQYERASYIAMFEAGLSGDEVAGLKDASNRAFGTLTIAASALGGTLPHGTPISAEMMGAHIWALSHGMASLFAAPQKASVNRRKTPGAGELKNLFESGMMIYLKGLGIDVSAAHPGSD